MAGVDINRPATVRPAQAVTGRRTRQRHPPGRLYLLWAAIAWLAPGLKSERPASGFAPSSIPVGMRSGSQARVGTVPANNGTTAPDDQGATSSESSGGSSEIPSGGSPVSEVQSVSSASTGNSRPAPGERLASGARRTQRTFSSAADRLRGVRRQWGGLPSDAAPHTPPPRMPIDHGE